MLRISVGSISLEISPEWTLSTVILVGPAEEAAPDQSLLRGPTRPFQRNLIATMEQVANDATPETYIRRQVEGLRRAGVERRQLREVERVALAGGLNGLLGEQSITGPSGEVVRQMQLVCIKEHCACTLIASHLDGPPFEAVREEFRRMLLSFE